MGVMLPLTKKNNYQATILVCGGTKNAPGAGYNLNADDRCITIDFSKTNPSWELSTKMPNARVMPVSTILADGTILWAGGSSWGMAGGDPGDYRNGPSPVFQAEIYNPFDNTWKAVGSMSVARLYHSGSILLADGRVVVSGSEMQNYVDASNANQGKDCFPDNRTNACTSPFEHRLEAFEPPYLFSPGFRPVIKYAPPRVNYNSKFGVLLSTDARDISMVSLIRYSTSTHSTDTDQRFIEVEIQKRNSTYLLLQAPTNGSIAPPGNYHLFVLIKGKPSIAKTVLIGSGKATVDPDPITDSASSFSVSLLSFALFLLFI